MVSNHHYASPLPASLTSLLRSSSLGRQICQSTSHKRKFETFDRFRKNKLRPLSAEAFVKIPLPYLPNWRPLTFVYLAPVCSGARPSAIQVLWSCFLQDLFVTSVIELDAAWRGFDWISRNCDRNKFFGKCFKRLQVCCSTLSKVNLVHLNSLNRIQLRAMIESVL